MEVIEMSDRFPVVAEVLDRTTGEVGKPLGRMIP
jgi:hypothetical protein